MAAVSRITLEARPFDEAWVLWDMLIRSFKAGGEVPLYLPLLHIEVFESRIVRV
jgi:hypothetical protein